MQETWVRSLMREDPTCLRATKLMHHKYWICAPKPGSRSYWSPIKAMLCNKRSHGSERPVHQLQKSPHSSEDPAKPKKKKRCREQLLKDCFFFFLIYLFGCAGSLSCSMWDPVSWPGNEPGPTALGLQTQPLDHQGSPWRTVYTETCTKSKVTIFWSSKNFSS